MEAVEEPVASKEGDEEGVQDKDTEEAELEGEVSTWRFVGI